MKWRRRKQKELDDEMAKRDWMARGESAVRAEAAARRELGNAARMR
jgi:hypothetical protein